MRRLLFVDYENVRLDDIGSVDAAAELEVWVFIGPNQKNLPIETVKSLLPLGDRTQIIQIAKQGKNSLDFHICFELGALSRSEPKPDLVFVLSNDKGYDSIVEYARAGGLAVERITAMAQVMHTKAGPPQPGIADLIIGNLRKVQGNQRPRKKGTLRSYLTNQFKKTHSAEGIDLAIDQLFASGRLAEEKGKLKYDV